MKKGLSLVLLGFALTGCSSNTTNVSSYEDQIASLEQQLEEANAKIAELEGRVTVDNQALAGQAASSEEQNTELNGLKVVLTNMETMTIDTYEGKKDVLKVDFDFTNNSEETVMFDSTMDIKAFQDAVELDTVFNTETTGQEGDNGMKEIRPGGTISISTLFETKSTSPIEVEVSELFSFTDEVIQLGTYNFQ